MEKKATHPAAKPDIRHSPELNILLNISAAQKKTTHLKIFLLTRANPHISKMITRNPKTLGLSLRNLNWLSQRQIQANGRGLFTPPLRYQSSNTKSKQATPTTSKWPHHDPQPSILPIPSSTSTSKPALDTCCTPSLSGDINMSRHHERHYSASHFLHQNQHRIFANNQEWVASKCAHDPSFFVKLAAGQQPEYLFVFLSSPTHLIISSL